MVDIQAEAPPPPAPKPLTVKVSVWQGRRHVLPQAFQGNHLGAGEDKKVKGPRCPGSPHLL